MKKKLNPVPAAKRTQEKINNVHKAYVEIMPEEAQKLVTGIYELDAKVKLKDSQIVTITKEKSDLQQLVKTKTSEIQSKNSLLSQKEQLLAQKEQLLSELRIREENQLKEEYISVLHQLNPKVFSANYEDWNDKAQGFKDIIDQGKFKTIRKKLPVYKQQLAQKIETEKLALATKEAEKLDKAKQEVVSILNQLHPTLYPANFEEWSTHHAAHNSTAKALLDSGNLEAIEKKLVHYRGLLKEEVQNKVQLILQKEQEFKSLNDTFTTTVSTKEEEIITKNQLLAQEVQSKNQLALEKEMEEKLRIEKEQEIERLRELLAQNEIQTQELLARQELEKQELLIQKENELREKDELLLVKESEIHNKSAEKNRIIEELASNLLTKEEEIVSKDLKIGEVSHKVKKNNRKSVAKDKEIEALKALIEQSKLEKEELLAQQELALANKSHIKNQIIDELEEEINLQENEVGNLRVQNLEKELMNQKQEKLLIQKDIELEDLLEQKDEAVRNKSFAKNQIIGGLREAMTEKEKETYQLQIELLMKQLAAKEKALEDACAINDLQGQLVVLKALYGHDVSFAEEFSAIQFRAENSIANNDFDDIADLSRYISRLVEAERDNSEPMSLATLMALNESPINHGEEQPIYRSIYIEDRSVQPGSSLLERQMESLNISSIGRQNQVVQTGGSLIAGEQMPVPLNQGNIMNHGAQNQNLIGNIIGNFDNQHITHSVVLGGENSESFSIIDAENSH